MHFVNNSIVFFLLHAESLDVWLLIFPKTLAFLERLLSNFLQLHEFFGGNPTDGILGQLGESMLEQHLPHVLALFVYQISVEAFLRRC